MSAKPIVVKTWPSSCPLRRLRKAFHSAMPTSEMVRAPSSTASGKLPVRQITVRAT